MGLSPDSPMGCLGDFAQSLSLPLPTLPSIKDRCETEAINACILF